MARRFIFRLHALLSLRQALEREARRHLVRMVTRQQEAAGKVTELRGSQRAAFEIRRAPRGASIDLLRWRLVERYLVSLERRIRAAEAQLEEARHQVDTARGILLKARQSRMMLLRLKERRMAAHDLEEARKELRETDELSVLRRGRQEFPAPPLSGGVP
ncbi:MAG: flagellar export protein FliJ [Acidobacteria bacterium]|nr:flagellar export protein FliJ [Acidobacteriota bacterium]